MVTFFDKVHWFYHGSLCYAVPPFRLHPNLVRLLFPSFADVYYIISFQKYCGRKKKRKLGCDFLKVNSAVKYVCCLLLFNFQFSGVMQVEIMDRATSMVSRLTRENGPMKIDYVSRSHKIMFAVRLLMHIG